MWRTLSWYSLYGLFFVALNFIHTLVSYIDNLKFILTDERKKVAPNNHHFSLCCFEQSCSFEKVFNNDLICNKEIVETCIFVVFTDNFVPLDLCFLFSSKVSEMDVLSLLRGRGFKFPTICYLIWTFKLLSQIPIPSENWELCYVPLF